MKKLLIATLALAVGLPVLAQTNAPMNSDTMKPNQLQSMEQSPVAVPGASGTPIIEPSLGSGTSTTSEKQKMEESTNSSSTVPSTDSSMGSGTNSRPQQSMEDSDNTSVSPNSTDVKDIDEDANLEEEE